MIALLVARAWAHGGEDHAEEAAALAIDADAVRAAASSAHLDAVVRVGRAPTGQPAPVTVLLADWTTSAPIAGATARVALSGPASVAFDPAAVRPGVYASEVAFPAAGDYAGSLVVTTAERTDLLALSGLTLGEPAHTHDVLPWAGACAGIAGGALAIAGAAALGYLVGRRRGALGAAALAAAAGVSAHGGEEHAETAAPATATGSLELRLESQFLLELRTQVVTDRPFRDPVPALGHFVARPGEAATLRAPVSGVLVAPPGGFPAPGAQVAAGDLLAEISETPGRVDRAALGQARSDAGTRVAEARAALALAERDASRAAGLGDAISERERLEREQAVAVARESLRQAEQARSAAGAGGATVAIRAPLAGVLGPLGARPGDQIEAGSPLFKVSAVSGLWVEAHVPERHALGIEPGSPATVSPAATPGAALPATVLDAGQEADPETGTVLVTLAVQGEALDLRPGFGARAWIGRGPERNALTVPEGAVVDSNGVPLAFVKVGPEAFEARELAIGARAGGLVEVRAGLRAGDRVVTEATYALRSLAGR